MAPRRWQLAGGAELAISYGDKSNEELLFHYGAALLLSQHAASRSQESWQAQWAALPSVCMHTRDWHRVLKDTSQYGCCTPASPLSAKGVHIQAVKTHIFRLHLMPGFVEENNSHDVLMVACPLPPVEQWGEDMHARAALLASRGLTPQLFLPAPQPDDRCSLAGVLTVNRQRTRTSSEAHRADSQHGLPCAGRWCAYTEHLVQSRAPAATRRQHLDT